MKTSLFLGLMLAAVAAQGETDWARLNVAAREHAKTPIRAGVPGVRPFWNAHAKAFIHPPAFEFGAVDGTSQYRFALMAEKKEVAAWTAAKPWLPIPADVWDSLKPGYYTVKVEGLGERTFYRAAVFQGPYPKGACDYRTAARRVYAAVYNLPQVQGWKTPRARATTAPPRGACTPLCTICRRCRAGKRATIRRKAMTSTAIPRRSWVP